ncbi:MAG: site-specific integrase [Candidatus Cloacimonetes bacterium]|jgi:integrase|nr:site-specific integrase [Candidatus Cloacimonadota bacterium]MBT4333340.1 site-specific integrase [Candidatus Cloacimonadota bacterium]MBT4575118.1 site-specific integrase [Candidatus Cloacimonadota bacterium]
MNNQIPSILKQLNNHNKGYRIKLRHRKNPSNLYRLYLDYWDGNRRHTDNLKLYISGKGIDIVTDKNTLKLALTIRNKKESLLLESNTGIAFSSSKDIVNFIEFFKTFSETKKDTNYRISHDHFKRFFKNDFIDIKKIDYEISEDYMNYLLSLNITRYTAQHYLAAFKATLNHAIKLRLIDYNPANMLTIKYERKNIERLTIEELQDLIKTDCKYRDLKSGFLFACFTGLRISDIRNLKFSDIVDDHIKIIQQKTKTETDTKLHGTAKMLLDEQRNNKKDDYVFHIPHGGKTSKRLKAWILKAGIKKKITFHCSRHTFGCLLTENGVDVFTVKKIMTHKDIRTTLQYVEKVDKTKDQAIDKLPVL